MLELTYNTEKREIGTLMDQIDKQYFTVGKHLQEFLLAKKEAEGKELKTVRNFMESQRNYVWETWRASNLIQSILLKNPVPEITVYRHDDKSQFRKTVDGQQRLTTIYLFMNDQFRLDMSKTMFPEFKIEDETFKASETLQGKTFSELPELWQDIIKLYQLRITTMNNCSEEDAEKAFVQMNSGAKGLKASEIRKAAMGMSTRKFFREVLESDWVLHALTLKSSLGNAGDEIISQMITLLHNSNGIELSKDNIDNVIYSYRETGLPEQTKEDVSNICNYLNEATEIWINNKKKADESQERKGKKVKNYSTYRFPWLNKTNTVMLMYSAHQAIKNAITAEDFSTWAFSFFQNPNTEYKEGLNGKVNELKLVELRINAIQQEIKEIKKLNGCEQQTNEYNNEGEKEQSTDNNQDQEKTLLEFEKEIEELNQEQDNKDQQEEENQEPEELEEYQDELIFDQDTEEGLNNIVNIINNQEIA